MKQFLLAAMLCGLVVSGCAPEAPDRTQTQSSVNAAMTAFAEGKPEEALAAFTAAIHAGGLNPDQVVEVYTHRAVCRAATGDFAGAHADLDATEQGAASLDLVLAARGFVLEAEGDSAASAKALAKARAINPHVKAFSMPRAK